MADDAPQRIRGNTLEDVARAMGREVRTFYLLFECASGYAFFLAHGISQVDTSKFQAVEEYINRTPQFMELIDFQSFSSPDDALAEFNAISSSWGVSKCSTQFGAPSQPNV
ncbi:hypothetical protein DCAR_0830981 [Daucus carota subsp. sativus]|uniref:Uncharacterized protein n=1 Tax=Daucus carota subsp. sativus TaxID=79200 RepID=A0A175YM82_DAUCS|nr:hypothetical protein DCAR_0830981 [Daucus carota subsp. sativus]